MLKYVKGNSMEKRQIPELEYVKAYLQELLMKKAQQMDTETSRAEKALLKEIYPDKGIEYHEGEDGPDPQA